MTDPILTLDQLMARLTDLRATYPGNTIVAIHDLDTGWHVAIGRVRESRSVPGRLLLGYDGYWEGPELPCDAATLTDENTPRG